MLRRLAYLGLPFRSGQPNYGVQLAPLAIRKTGIIDRLRRSGCYIEDYGDLDFSKENTSRSPNSVSLANQKIHRCVSQLYQMGCVPISIGGDHSIAIGTISALAKHHPDAMVMWVDAHSDINCPDTTLTNNYHGMPLSLTTDVLLSRPKDFRWIEPNILRANQINMIGLRSVDRDESRRIRNHCIPFYNTEEMHHYGVQHVVRTILDHSYDRPIHLSFDIDSVDPDYAPSTGTPVSGGLTPDDVYKIGELIGATGRLVSMDIVEVNPAIGEVGEIEATITIAAQMIERTLNVTKM
jgi:arginase